MRGNKSNKSSAAPAAGLSARAALRAKSVAAVLLGAIVLTGLSACGSVQTTSYGPASSPESVSDPRPPVISGVPPTAAQAGVPYDYVPEVADAPGVALSFSITNKPSWATFSTATGELAGIPAAGDVGVSKGIEITVSDGVGSASVGPFQITVTAGGTAPPPDNSPPTISGTPATSVAAGEAYLFAPSASDAGGNALTFVIANRPAWATFDPTTGQLSGTPAAANVGSYPNIVISASDGTLATSLPAFTITVSSGASGSPPTIGGSPSATVTAGSGYDFIPIASDPAGNALTFAVQNLPSWASFSSANGELSGTPTAANVGSYRNIVISVSDGSLSASLPAFTISVSAAGSGPPTINGSPPAWAVVGTTYSFTPSATDPAGNALTFAVQNLPSWANFNTHTGQLSGMPAAANVGNYPNIVISVSDGTLSALLPAFSITVATPTTVPPPVISGSPPPTATVGSPYTFTPSSSDPTGDVLSFSIQNQPSWANFDPTSGRLSGTPDTASIGNDANIVISVNDGYGSASLPPFTIAVVAASSSPPSIGGNPPTTATVGATYSFTPSASDPQGGPLTFSIQNPPSWANFNANTGQLSGTPTAANLGNYPNIVISASDGTLSAALPAFGITVKAAASGPPTINGNPPTSVNVGATYSFTPTASDPEGNSLTFSIQNQPSWANFNPNTGQLSGTPTAANVGAYPNITISVSNGTASASLPAFSIAVNEVATGSLTVNWNPPTQNTNGTPLTNLAGYYVYYGSNPNAMTQSQQISNPGVTSYTITGLAPGTWYIGIVDFTASGIQSTLSNIASATVQ
jgi:hypothetical protein